MDLDEFTVDTEDDGVWIDLDDETQVKMTYLSPDSVQREVFRRQRRRGFRNLGMDDFDSVQKLTGEVLEKHILDWKEMKKGGVEFPCTPENKRHVLGIPEFRDAFERMARNIENFRRKEEDDGGKNSPGASSGISTGRDAGAPSGERS